MCALGVQKLIAYLEWRSRRLAEGLDRVSHLLLPESFDLGFEFVAEVRVQNFVKSLIFALHPLHKFVLYSNLKHTLKGHEGSFMSMLIYLLTTTAWVEKSECANGHTELLGEQDDRFW